MYVIFVLFYRRQSLDWCPFRALDRLTLPRAILSSNLEVSSVNVQLEVCQISLNYILGWVCFWENQLKSDVQSAILLIQSYLTSAWFTQCELGWLTANLLVNRPPVREVYIKFNWNKIAVEHQRKKTFHLPGFEKESILPPNKAKRSAKELRSNVVKALTCFYCWQTQSDRSPPREV